MTVEELLQKITEAKENNLTEFDISNSGLIELPPEIGQLTNLQSLNLSGNLLERLPKELENLNNLQELFLESNQLKEFPKEIIKLTNLTALDLSDNQISDLPEEIYGLLNLKELSIRNNQLIRLPRMINGLVNLQSLNLSENQINELPKEITQLTELEMLDLLDNNFTEFPKEIINLTKLHTLDLSGNKLVALPEEIRNLTNLEEINLSRTEINQFPAELRQSNNLKFLGLDESQLGKYGRELIKPGTIGLKIWQSKELEPITLDLNVISGIKSSRELLNFYSEIRKGERKPLNEAKIIVVGQVNAGKSSLIERLINDDFDPNRTPTNGVKIYKDWEIEASGRKILINIWDFGGHEINHATHQFFLTERSIYILLNDSTLDAEANRLEYWLEKIKILGGASPVIIVGNKTDERRTDINLSGLSKKYPNIKAYFPISCKNGDGIDELKNSISKILSEPGVIDDFMPTSWFQVKETLEKIVGDYIPYDKFLEICRENGITDEDIQKNLLNVLKNLGVVFNFGERTQETTVMNPEWLTEGVYNILNSNEVAEKKGILYLGELDRILEKDKYPLHKQRFIVDVMKKFDLCFEVEEDTKFLIPGLLPAEELDSDGWDEALGFEYRYKTFFVSIITKFIVKMYNKISDKIYWRTGVGLEYKVANFVENTALIKADITNKKIIIKVKGNEKSRREFFNIIRDKFDDIHKEFPEEFRQDISEQLQIPGRPEITVDYNHLLVLEKRGDKYYVPVGLTYEVSVESLLNGIESKEKRDEIIKRDESGKDLAIITKQKGIETLETQISHLEKIKSNIDKMAKRKGQINSSIQQILFYLAIGGTMFVGWFLQFIYIGVIISLLIYILTNLISNIKGKEWSLAKASEQIAEAERKRLSEMFNFNEEELFDAKKRLLELKTSL